MDSQKTGTSGNQDQILPLTYVLFLGGVTAAMWVKWIRIYGIQPIKTMAEVLAILIVPELSSGGGRMRVVCFVRFVKWAWQDREAQH